MRLRPTFEELPSEGAWHERDADSSQPALYGIIVLIPLAWGLGQTLIKASLLFR